MKHVTEHGLNDINLVKRVIDAAYTTYSAKMRDYSPSIKWTGDTTAVVSFAVKSKKIDVNFAADEKKVVITGKLPFIFRIFEKKITGVISKEMDEWIEKAKAGEFDAEPSDETAAE